VGLFKRPKPKATLGDVLRPLRADIAVLRGEIKQLQLEWDDTFDKIRRLTGRLAKRDALDARRANGAGEPAPEHEEPLIDPISAKILARRARGRNVE